MRDAIERVFVVLMRISNTPGQPSGHDDAAKLTMSRTNHAGALISVVASIICKMTRGDFELGNVEETISNHVMHGSRAHRPARSNKRGWCLWNLETLSSGARRIINNGPVPLRCRARSSAAPPMCYP